MKCAVVNGLGNARRLIEALKDGSVQYDFVEVMACPGGCAGGGGQPIYQDDKDFSPARTQNLYALDATAPLRFSHENPSIKTLYQDFLGRPICPPSTAYGSEGLEDEHGSVKAKKRRGSHFSSLSGLAYPFDVDPLTLKAPSNRTGPCDCI